MTFKVGLLSNHTTSPRFSRTGFIVLSFKNDLLSSETVWKELNF